MSSLSLQQRRYCIHISKYTYMYIDDKIFIRYLEHTHHNHTQIGCLLAFIQGQLYFVWCKIYGYPFPLKNRLVKMLSVSLFLLNVDLIPLATYSI